MKLLIDGKLALPPSSVSCFRDVTLYGSIFGDFDILVETRKRHQDLVWTWLKQKGAHDFVDDLVPHNIEHGISISYRKRCNICVTRITPNNLNFIVTRLREFACRYRQYDTSLIIDDILGG